MLAVIRNADLQSQKQDKSTEAELTRTAKIKGKLCLVAQLRRVLMLTHFPCPVSRYSRVESRETKVDANDLPDTGGKKSEQI